MDADAPAREEQEKRRDFTDSDDETLCPLDLHERAERLGVIAELADALKVAPESLRAEAEQHVTHFTVAGGHGTRRRHWMAHLRKRLHRQAQEGELKAHGLVAHETSADDRGWVQHSPGVWVDRGLPVIPVDTKKKELVDNFKNAGCEWQPQGAPELVDVHDFPSAAIGKAIPYGVYDVSANDGFVSVGVDHDTQYSP